MSQSEFQFMDKQTGALRSFAAAMMLAAGLSAPAQAIDLSWSGFATLGYAQSDENFQYLRWIDDGGTFNSETVAGLQLDVQFAPRWAATVQMRAAPATDHDSRWDVEPSWAFVAWRPADGWLLRAGKLRAPLYLYSEALDVGVAHDMARLPMEMYSVSPINEFVGVSATYDWTLDKAGDYLLSVTLFRGGDEIAIRGWVPNGLPPVLQSGASYLDFDLTATGLVFDLSIGADTRLRALALHARLKSDVASRVSYPRVELGPGLVYYKVDQAFPGPPIDFQNVIHNDLYTLGMDHRFGDGWRVTAEYARIEQRDVEFGSDAHGGYVALFKEWGRFTPYVSFGSLKSTDEQLDIYRNLVSNPLPPGSLGGVEALVNAAQEAAAVSLLATDQRTFALGTSIIVPGGKLKMEWAHTWIDDTSQLIDERPGDSVLKDRQLNVWTLSYNVAF